MTVHQKTIDLLIKSYHMELETVVNYLANSVNLDGVRAEQIKESLAADVTEEIDHARQIGERIKQLGGTLPGSANLAPLAHQHQPPADTNDVKAVILGVIANEEAAVVQYLTIINAARDHDPVTAALCTRLLADEERHLLVFRGYLRDYENDTKARGIHNLDLDATDAFIPAVKG